MRKYVAIKISDIEKIINQLRTMNVSIAHSTDELSAMLEKSNGRSEPSASAEIARLQKELEETRIKAARYDWIEKQANKGATNCGQMLNQNLLNGHRHRNRLMYSFLIRAENSSEPVDMTLGDAIDAAIRQIGGE